MNKTLRLALAGIFTALVFLATYFIKVPAGTGYINAGDGVILLAAVWLGYPAVIPAALGSALADIAAGYALYAPGTFAIKGVMATLTVLILKNMEVKFLSKIMAFCLAEAAMITGYFFYETLLYGFAGAFAGVLPNSVQAAAGVVLGMALSMLPRKNNFS